MGRAGSLESRDPGITREQLIQKQGGRCQERQMQEWPFLRESELTDGNCVCRQEMRTLLILSRNSI